MNLSLSTKIIFLLFVLGAVFFGPRVYRHFTRRVSIPPPRPEVELTIIPGWNLRQVAGYLVIKGFSSSTDDVYMVTGKPAKMYANCPLIRPAFFGVDDSAIPVCYGTTSTAIVSLPDDFANRPLTVSVEGYLAPDTYRVYANASVRDIVVRLMQERDTQVDYQEVQTIERATQRTWHQILTMASIIEKETKHDEDRPKVADILWRRFNKGMALQVDSSVHYAIDKTGDVFTTDKDREVDSPWNTYKYPGLPPGPISNPGLESIKAALYPEKNNYWYFLSGRDGKMYYAKTLPEHNANKKHL